jgi:hypothetical protein
MLRLKAICVAALIMIGAAAVPANAAPVGANVLQGAAATGIDTTASKVHYRRYRHCHRRYGRRRCHGRRGYRRGGWTGIGIYLGKRRYHHNRHHRHRWRKRHH